MNANEIEDELHDILRTCQDGEIESVECVADEGVLEVSLKAKGAGKLVLELESPWRILEEGQIKIGSGTLAVSEDHDIPVVTKQIAGILKGASFQAFGFDDFFMELKGRNDENLKLEQFSDFVSEDPEDYNIAVHWYTESGETHILVGPGSIFLTDSAL